MTSVFISYSSTDRDPATFLAEALRKEGVDVFLDYLRLKAGSSFSEQLRLEISSRDFFVLLISPRSVDSKWVQAEVNLAHSLNKPILPVVLEDVVLTQSAFWFIAHEEQVRIVGWTPDKTFSSEINKLKGAIIGTAVAAQPPAEGSRRLVTGTRVTPESWLEEYPILERFPQVRSMRITRPVIEGQSGSRVFIVKADLRDDKKPMTCFLKIHHAQGNTPLLRHQQAYESFKKYMPRVLDATPWNADTSQIALLYSAEKTVDSSISLSNLLETSGKQAYELITTTCEAIAGWNRPLDFDEDYKFTPVIELIQRALSHSDDETLQYRRLEDPDASIFARMQKSFGLNWSSSQIKVDGKGGVLPNPLAYIKNPALWGNLHSKPITWLCGHVHGDLNIRNILSLDGHGGSLAIIDFDTYDRSNLIFLDYFQLELGIILKLMPPADPANHHELIRLSDYLARHLRLEDIPDLGVVSIGLNALLRPIREKLAEFWGDDEDLIASIWIARMVVGLELARKFKLTPAERAFALLYAADSLTSLLEYLRIEPDQYGAPTTIGWGTN